MSDPMLVAGTRVLAKYAASGVGAIAGPIFATWRAYREGKAQLISAKYQAEVRLIEARAESEVLAIMSSSHREVLQSINPGAESAGSSLEIRREGINQAIEFQTMKRVINSSSVIEDAANKLEDKEVHDHEPDADWTARFFDHVQDISSADLRNIWTRILADEVTNPGQTSVRTLDILRNMTSEDASTFEAICPYLLRNDFIFRAESSPKLGTLRYNEILHLQNCGLLTSGALLEMGIDFNQHGEIVLNNPSTSLVISNSEDSPSRLVVPVIAITSSGQELASIIECTADEDYLRSFAKFLREKNCRLYRLEGVVPLPDGVRFMYSKRIPIEP